MTSNHAIMPKGRPALLWLCLACLWLGFWPQVSQADEKVSTDCKACHEFTRRDLLDDHRAGWLRYHGAAAELQDVKEHGENCLTCHVKKDCVACHTTQPPKTHTNFWRLQGHGLTASTNRESCATCHTQDFCSRCHNETAPRNHTGAWRQQHCVECHLEGGYSPETNSCAVCHQSPKTPFHTR